MAGKGSKFERDLCRKLSLWWTQHDKEPRDDVFWRTSQSGGRATTRAKKGKKTAGHCGDISAMDRCGQAFIETVTIEAKRGYNRHTLHDIIDCPDRGAEQEWERWIEQAEAARKRAGSETWMIIAKRDRRDIVVLLPGHDLWYDPIAGVSPCMNIELSGKIFYMVKLDDLLPSMDVSAFGVEARDA